MKNKDWELLYKADISRYVGGTVSKYLRCFFKYFRKAQCSPNSFFLSKIYKFIRQMHAIEIYPETKIGEGLYIGHSYGITINKNAELGNNINIHKGVTIGQENRGKRKGAPKIGNKVWIGVNSTIVGNVIIGDDVLIAPNSFVNCDVPSHSIVFGNPCVIKFKENATEGYINNKYEKKA